MIVIVYESKRIEWALGKNWLWTIILGLEWVKVTHDGGGSSHTETDGKLGRRLMTALKMECN